MSDKHIVLNPNIDLLYEFYIDKLGHPEEIIKVILYSEFERLNTYSTRMVVNSLASKILKGMQLSLWHTSIDFIVAHDMFDAIYTLAKHLDVEPSSFFPPDSIWSKTLPSSNFQIWFSDVEMAMEYNPPEGLILDAELTSDRLVISATARQWCDHRGRGFLCSSDSLEVYGAPA